MITHNFKVIKKSIWVIFLCFFVIYALFLTFYFRNDERITKLEQRVNELENEYER